ncbi:TlpA disulfide reductase family protein [Exiguobacterium mexicanum]|uniref:TlpA disulfide reductase family protein n=1 Tax=Exiguobacterium mexicanum TaxID=340146 RepID=UPI0037C0DC11
MRFHKLAISLIMAGLIAGLAYQGYDEYKTSQASERPVEVATDDDVLGGLEVGQRAPEFALETTEGQSVSLADYEGQQVILNFWATWCPPCREELPELIEFGEDTGIPVLGVNATKNERLGKRDVDAFYKKCRSVSRFY